MAGQKDASKGSSLMDGIVNPSGAMIAGFAPVYLLLIPVTSYLSSPCGILQRTAETAASYIIGTSSVSTSQFIPALSAAYIFWTFGGSAAISAAGQAMARQEGLEDSHPRQHVQELRGLPLRLKSAHNNLTENFPGFALAAALAQAIAPGDHHIVNLLSLHVVLRIFVYYGSHLLDIPLVRTLSFVMGNSAVINVCWKLSQLR